MACSSLIKSGDAVERNSLRAAYIHKAEHLDERKLNRTGLMGGI